MCVEDDARGSDSPVLPIRLSQEILHCQSFAFFCSYLTNSTVPNTFRQLPLIALMRRSAWNWIICGIFKCESLVSVVKKHHHKWFIVWETCWPVANFPSTSAGCWCHEWHLFKPVYACLFVWSRYLHTHGVICTGHDSGSTSFVVVVPIFLSADCWLRDMTVDCCFFFLFFFFSGMIKAAEQESCPTYSMYVMLFLYFM